MTNMEIVHGGWLTKSPPEKKIGKAKWRKRWFVLRQSGNLPGQYLLEYFTDQSCRKLKGSIDLDQCEQVDAGLTFESRKRDFKYIFDIKTSTRTYYLVSETEDDMNKWVDCICQVCGLKRADEDEQETATVSQHEYIQEPSGIAAISHSPCVTVAQPAQRSSVHSLNTNSTSSLQGRMSPIQASLLSHSDAGVNESGKMSADIHRLQESSSPYIYLSDCHSGTPKVSSDEVELMIRRDSMPDIPAPPVPVSDQEYYNLMPHSQKTSAAASPVPLPIRTPTNKNAPSDELHKVIPAPQLVNGTQTNAIDEWYKVPRNQSNANSTLEAGQNEVVIQFKNQQEYDVPLHQQHDSNQSSCVDLDNIVPAVAGRLDLEEPYKVPRSGPPMPVSNEPDVLPPPPRPPKSKLQLTEQYVNILDSVPPVKLQTDISHFLGYDVPRSHYDVPSSVSSESKPVAPPRPAKPKKMSSTSTEELDVSSCPPVMTTDLKSLCLSHNPQQSYTNAAIVVPVEPAADSVLSSQVAPPPVHRELNPKRMCLNSATSSTSTSPPQTKATTTFTKSNGSTNDSTRTEVHLPHRAQRDSTSDSSTGGSNSCVFEDDDCAIMAGVVSNKNKASLPSEQQYQNKVPPAPRLAGTVEYLDLDLDMPSGATVVKSPPKTPRSPDSPSGSSTGASTVYKTVDFVKTKALNEITQNREQMRKSH